MASSNSADMDLSVLEPEFNSNNDRSDSELLKSTLSAVFHYLCRFLIAPPLIPSKSTPPLTTPLPCPLCTQPLILALLWADALALSFLFGIRLSDFLMSQSFQ